jgi:hypothetical protein
MLLPGHMSTAALDRVRQAKTDTQAFLARLLQRTAHFKRLVLERALPLLAHRARVPFDVLP